MLVQVFTGDDIYVFNAKRLEDVLIEGIRPIAENESIIKIGHNLQIEYLFLRKYGIMMDGLKDLFMQETVIHNGRSEIKQAGRRSLDGLCYNYLGISLNKAVRQSFINARNEEFSDAQINYAALDVKYLFAINEKQEYILKNLGLWKAARIENGAVPVIAEIAYNGLYLNKDKWLDLNKHNRGLLAVALQELDSYVVGTGKVSPDLFGMSGIHFNSNDELIAMLHNLGYPVPDTLNNTLLLYLPKKFYELIRKFRVYAKTISTYGESYLKFVNKKTGRVHPNVAQFFAESARITTSKPNMQAIPVRDNPEYRLCFEAQDTDWLLNASDYAGQELRITAELCKEDLWLDCLNEDRNLHAEIGTKLFKTSITKKHEKYAVIKNLNFGIIYGAGASKLVSLYRSVGADISVEDAEKTLIDYYKLNPKLVGYIDSYMIQCIQQGYSESILGTRRYFNFPAATYRLDAVTGRYRFYPKSKLKEDFSALSGACREAFNHRIQATASNMTKLALIFYFKALKTRRPKAFLVNSIHDEILDEVHKDACNEWAAIKSQAMLDAEAFILKDVKPSVEYSIAKHWKK